LKWLARQTKSKARILQHGDGELPPQSFAQEHVLLPANVQGLVLPDFLCQLADGRVMAVENKGKHLYDAGDAEEKRAVGAVWASRSGGKCLFAMPTEGSFSIIGNAVNYR
jgi:hypothetical protein